MNETTTQNQLTSIPARIILSGGFTDDNNEASLCCPVCGYDYVHLGKVEVFQGKTKSVSTWDKTEVSANDTGRQANRGSVVTIHFWCESHHSFSYSFAFHKGNTSLILEAGEGPPDETLWRD